MDKRIRHARFRQNLNLIRTMNLPAVIDVALGLIVLYLLLSTLCSFGVELLATVFWWRKNLLYKTIARLLTGRSISISELPTKGILPKLKGEHPDEVIDRFWKHRLAVALAPAQELPSYIEPSTFAAIVIDLAVPGADTGALPSTSEALDKVLQQAATTAEATPEQLEQLKRKQGEQLDKKLCLSPQHLRPLRQAVLSAFRACGSNRPLVQTVPPIEDLRRSLEKWYNEAMERSCGQYKRRAQRWLLILGAVAALAFNADTIRTAYVLSTNDSLRNTTATYAATLAGGTNSVTGTTDLRDSAATNDVSQLRANLVASMKDLQKLQQLGFPLGWKGGGDASLNFEPYGHLDPFLIGLLKLAGLLATALAVSLGAPFWFDLLNKLASLRGSGNRVSTEPDTSKSKAKDAATDAAASSAGPVTAADTSASAPSTTFTPPDFMATLRDTRVGFHPGKAYWMAEAALLAYADKAPVEAAVKQWGLELKLFFCTVEACQGFLAVSSDKKVALLAFRGTEKKLEDWKTDSEFELIASPTGAGKTHRGFTEQQTAVHDDVLAKLRESLGADTLLYVTGHSLGAALATMMAARLAEEKLWGIHAVHTFGSPRVGDRDFCKSYEVALGHCTYRFVNAEDLVTRIPPRVIPGKDWKYDHVGQIVYFDSDGRMQLSAGFWDRFLNTVINAVADFRKELQTLLKDHSMDGYVRLLRKQVGTPPPPNK